MWVGVARVWGVYALQTIAKNTTKTAAVGVSVNQNGSYVNLKIRY